MICQRQIASNRGKEASVYKHYLNKIPNSTSSAKKNVCLAIFVQNTILGSVVKIVWCSVMHAEIQMEMGPNLLAG